MIRFMHRCLCLAVVSFAVGGMGRMSYSQPPAQPVAAGESAAAFRADQQSSPPRPAHQTSPPQGLPRPYEAIGALPSSPWSDSELSIISSAASSPSRLENASGEDETKEVGRRGGKRLPHPSFSAEAFGSSTSGREETGSRQASRTGVSSPWKTVTALAFVIGLILLVAKLLKKHGPTSVAGLPDEAIELLGKRAIDRQQAIHLVRCGSRILVLGVSPGEVRTLAEITDPIEVDFLSGVCRHKGQQTTVLQTFRTLFEKYSPGAGRAAGSAPSVKSGEPPAAHVGPRPPFGSAPSRGPDDVSFEAVAVANRSESVSHPLTS